MKNHNLFRISIHIILMATIPLLPLMAQNLKENPELDAKVKKFLNEHEGMWHDLNIPTVDGQTLYDIVVKNNYQSALEIGTSTGHSGIWIAWALSKTGGKLTTIEIDEERHQQVLDDALTVIYVSQCRDRD